MTCIITKSKEVLEQEAKQKGKEFIQLTCFFFLGIILTAAGSYINHESLVLLGGLFVFLGGTGMLAWMMSIGR